MRKVFVILFLLFLFQPKVIFAASDEVVVTSTPAPIAIAPTPTETPIPLPVIPTSTPQPIAIPTTTPIPAVIPTAAPVLAEPTITPFVVQVIKGTPPTPTRVPAIIVKQTIPTPTVMEKPVLAKSPVAVKSVVQTFAPNMVFPKSFLKFENSSQVYTSSQLSEKKTFWLTISSIIIFFIGLLLVAWDKLWFVILALTRDRSMRYHNAGI